MGLDFTGKNRGRERQEAGAVSAISEVCYGVAVWGTGDEHGGWEKMCKDLIIGIANIFLQARSSE